MVTQRDTIWAAVLQHLDTHRTITAADITDSLAPDPPAERTVRATLNAMETLGLLGSTGGSGRAPREFFPKPPDSPIETPGYTPRNTTPTSPIPYPGAKGQLADWIIQTMPAHDTYVEAFGGAAGILYQKPRSKYEIYNDINDDLTQFFRMLRDRPNDLADWLQSVPYARSQYNQWVESFYNGDRPEDPIARAGRFFAIRYMQYLGVADGPNGFKTRARRSPARTFDNARQRIHSLADRFAQVIIESCDYQTLLANYDDGAADVLFYLDPPYQGTTTHQDATIDYDTLTDTLHSIENDWMLSCSKIPANLTEYTTLDRDIRHRMQRSGGDVTEHLVCNFNPADRSLFNNQHTD